MRYILLVDRDNRFHRCDIKIVLISSLGFCSGALMDEQYVEHNISGLSLRVIVSRTSREVLTNQSAALSSQFTVQRLSTSKLRHQKWMVNAVLII